MIYIIFLVKTVGLYGSDAEGNPWTTFGIMNGETTCDECGATISGGWVRGRLFEEQFHVCCSHVQLHSEATEGAHS